MTRRPAGLKACTTAITLAAVAALGALVMGQTTQKPMSPEGAAQVQVLGTWTKPTAGVHARPRNLPGRQVDRDQIRPAAAARARPVRLGAELRQGRERCRRAGISRAAGLARGREQIDASQHGSTAGVRQDHRPGRRVHLFVDLKLPEWTLIVSRWDAQDKFDPNNKTALWGAYGYTPDKDVVRVPMKLDKLPYAVDQLTWSFVDMKNDGGRIALSWGNDDREQPFTASN